MKCGHNVLYIFDFANQPIPVRPDGCLICEKDELESKLHTATNLLRLWAGSVDDRTVLNEFDRQLLDETVALTEAPK